MVFPANLQFLKCLFGYPTPSPINLRNRTPGQLENRSQSQKRNSKGIETQRLGPKKTTLKTFGFDKNPKCRAQNLSSEADQGKSWMPSPASVGDSSVLGALLFGTLKVLDQLLKNLPKRLKHWILNLFLCLWCHGSHWLWNVGEAIEGKRDHKILQNYIYFCHCFILSMR